MSDYGFANEAERTMSRFTERMLIAAVARSFYAAGRTKSEIADEFGLSRFRVARLIEKALANGTVRIEFDPLWTGVDYELSDQLQRRFELHNVLVAPDKDGEADLDLLGQLTAMLLGEISGPRDVIGFSWNRAMEAISRYLPPMAAQSVVQLCGAWPGAGERRTSLDLVRDVARLSRGRAYTFYAPMIASDPIAAQAIRRQSDFVAASAMFDKVTVALVGVGEWSPRGSTLWSMFTEDQCRRIVEDGVLAEMSGITFDGAGNAIDSILSDVSIGISATELGRCEEVIATVFGVERMRAVHAVLCGKRITSLITHASAARALLTMQVRNNQGTTP
jgi:DNA-binding transcriptional regulator LsrR (DeoR family)